MLFVKLRQFRVAAGATSGRHGRRRLATRRDSGVEFKLLYEQDGFSDRVSLERWQPHADLGVVSHEDGAELFVLDGEFSDESGTYAARLLARCRLGSRHHLRTTGGCTLYVKRGGLAYLKSAADAD